MAHKETKTHDHTERKEDTPFASLVPAAFAMFGTKKMEEFAKMQDELVTKLQETNRKWLDRLESERNLVSDLGSKLTAARSIPDAMTAWQDWATRRFEMVTEDRAHLLADYQIFSEAGARLLSNSWLQNGSAASI